MPDTPYVKRVEVGEDIAVDPKNPFSSTGWWGSLTAIVAFGFAWMVRTHRLPAEIEEPVRSLSLDLIAGAIAAGLAMWGRWRAARPLGIGGPMQKTVK